MPQILQKLISPLFKKKDFILVVEFYEGLLRACFFRVNFESKNIELIKSIESKFPYRNLSMGVLELKRVLKKFGKLSRYRIIVSLDSVFATTFHSTASILRDKPKDAIDDSELDNRVAQGIWKLFDKQRSLAAAKMNAGDLEVLLADIKVKKIRLDNHRVLNPLGFSAKNLEIQFIQTFNARVFKEMLHGIFPKDRIGLVAESGTVEADVILRSGSPENFLLVDLFQDKVNVFFSDGKSISFLKSLDWGRKDLIASLAGFFSLPEDVANKIFGLYLMRQASGPVIKKIEKLLMNASENLSLPLAELANEYNPSRIYFLSFFDLPEFIFGSNFRTKFSSKIKFLPLNLGIIRDGLGFEVKIPKELAKDSLFSPLASLLSFYFSPQDDKINKIAKRHARWLVG